MDHQRDFLPFQRTVSRLCVTFDKFANDEIIEAWWKALKDCNFHEVERAIDEFIARADEKTKFPRPGQFRSVPLAANDRDAAKDRRFAEDNARNWKAFCDRFPYSGPIREKMAMAARIMASEHEASPAHAEAFHEYLALERRLGERGRFEANR